MNQRTWSILSTIPTLAVPDIELGIEYYKRLGFDVDWRFPEDAPTHAGLIRGECSIMLANCEPKERADIYFIVDDVAACHAEIAAASPWEIASRCGAAAERDDCPPARALEAPQPPADTEYGLRDFSLVDPWGHHFTFGQPVESSDACRETSRSPG